jgi:hypothetical protein
MYTLTCLKIISVLKGYGEFAAYMLGKQYGCWSSVAYYSWYLSTPAHNTNVLILMQCEYLSAEAACRRCFSEWQGMY